VAIVTRVKNGMNTITNSAIGPPVSDKMRIRVCHEALTSNAECGQAKCRVSCRTVRWIRRLGVAGFLFFLVKGLLWLIVPALVARGLWSS